MDNGPITGDGYRKGLTMNDGTEVMMVMTRVVVMRDNEPLVLFSGEAFVGRDNLQEYKDRLRFRATTGTLDTPLTEDEALTLEVLVRPF